MEKEWEVNNFVRENLHGSFDLVTGQGEWKNLFYGCMGCPALEEWLRLPKTWYFLLSGESGTGKHYLALNFAAEMEKRGYSVLELNGYDFMADTPDEIYKRIEAVYRKLSEGQWFVLLYEPDRIVGTEAVLLLSRKLEILKECDIPVIVTAVTENLQAVPETLGQLFFLCELEKPKEKDRVDYFTSFWKKSFLQKECEDGLTVRQIAEITEGLNWRQLDMLRKMTDGAVWRSYLRNYGTEAAVDEVAGRLIKETSAGKFALPWDKFENYTNAVRRGKSLEKKKQTGSNENGYEVERINLQENDKSVVSLVKPQEIQLEEKRHTCVGSDMNSFLGGSPETAETEQKRLTLADELPTFLEELEE